jgi:cobalamin biosynthetic protein CobC
VLEHGGGIQEAARRWGFAAQAWLDLSTGINPDAYPAPAIPPSAWRRLPEGDEALLEAARAYYGCASVLAAAGAQAAIQALPRLRARSRVAIGAPTYGEHARAWSRAGHRVAELPHARLDANLPEADVVVVVNPNNPTGDIHCRERLLQWHAALAARGGWLVLDEAYIDATGAESLAPAAGAPGLVVLRSLGKFFGLAGARIGFVCGAASLLEALAEELGPWHVAAPAQIAARAALADRAWQARTRARLAQAAARLGALLESFGIETRGTSLFRWWQDTRAPSLHDALARKGILTRLFLDCRPPGIRFGLPGEEPEWRRLARSLGQWRAA